MLGLKLLATTILFLPVPAMAQEVAKADSVPAAKADAGPPPICTDRPNKNTAACTVPKGSFQLESDIFNWTRFDFEGTRTDTILYTNPTLKYGLTSSTDIQVKHRAVGDDPHSR